MSYVAMSYVAMSYVAMSYVAMSYVAMSHLHCSLSVSQVGQQVWPTSTLDPTLILA